jgi:hypothetical protein
MRARWRGALLVLVLTAVGGRRAVAQDVNHLYDKFQVSVTGAAVILGTTIRVDSDVGDGTELDTEDDLGLDRAGVRPRIGFRWHPGRRHQLEASYIFINRSGGRSISEDVTVDSVTYTAGATIDTKLGSDQLGVIYRFAFHASDKSLIGAAIGVGATFFDVNLTGTGTISDGENTETGTFTVQKSLTGPTASIGGFGQWRLGEKWYLEADLRALYVPIDNIDITILEGGAAFRYFVKEWLGFEAGYTISSQKVEITATEGALVDSDFVGKLTYNTNTVRAGAIVAF